MKLLIRIIALLAIIQSGIVYAADPALPTTFTTTYSAPAIVKKVGTICSGGCDYSAGQLQTALDDAADSGEAWTLVLTAGETFTGGFKLKPKSSTVWTYVISSDLASLSAGRRVLSSDVIHMPIISVNVAYVGNWHSCIQTYNNASYYRFVGIHFTASWNETAHLIMLGGYSSDTYANTTPQELYDTMPSDAADLPSYIWFDRCYIKGNQATIDSTHWTNTGIRMDGTYMAVFDSIIENIGRMAESYGIQIVQGDGPYKIKNNYLEAAGMSVFVGGADPYIQNSVPSDIEIYGNYIWKKDEWMLASPQVAVKNNIELKNAQRVLIEANYLGNVQDNHVGQQLCTSIVLTVRNQYATAPWAILKDITIKNNKIQKVAIGVRVSGMDSIPHDSIYYNADANHTSNYKITYSNYNDRFGAANVGMTITITGGTGWTPGDYTITSVGGTLPSSTYAILDRAAASDGATHASGRLVNASQQTENVLVENNSFDYLDIYDTIKPLALHLTSTPDAAIKNLIVRHNLFMVNGVASKFMWVSGNAVDVKAVESMEIADNIGFMGDYSIMGSGTGQGIPSLNNYTDSYTFTNNVLVNRSIDASYAVLVGDFNSTTPWYTKVTRFPTGIWGPPNISSIGFTNYESTPTVDTDYELIASSPYKGQGSSGSDPGPSWSSLRTAVVAISESAYSDVTKNQAVVSWRTNYSHIGKVEYGLDTAYGSTSQEVSDTVSHSITLLSLTPNTTYHYRIVSDLATSSDATFTTLSDDLPTISITAPTSSPTYSTITAALSLGGTASDNVAVTSVTWACDNCTVASGTATGTDNWSFSVTLNTGLSHIIVTAHDGSGNTGSAQLDATLESPSLGGTGRSLRIRKPV